MTEKEKATLRRLASQVAEIAAQPDQRKKIERWRANNDLEQVDRPPVFIDQLPWNELNTTPEMQPECEEPLLRWAESQLRATLYRMRHFPADAVIRPYFDLPKTVHGLYYGYHASVHSLKVDATSDVASQKFDDLLKTEEDLETLKEDVITVDSALDAQKQAILEDAFGDILPVKQSGVCIHSGVWDRISFMRSVTSIYEDLMDNPELIEKTVNKFVWLTQRTIDQCEALDLLEPDLTYIHCTGAFTKDLPGKHPADRHVKAGDCWSFGMSQVFSEVSPAMHEYFEIDLVKPLYERFGLMYYGCCEPLDRKVDIIRKIRNVRKISMSPWANADRGADAIGRDYVFSCKPNPAFLSTGLNEEAIRAQIETTLEACRRNNTPVEFILKDVSTVDYDVSRLDRWHDLVMSILGA